MSTWTDMSGDKKKFLGIPGTGGNKHGWNPIDEAKKAVRKLVGEARSGINKLGGQIKKDLRKVERDIEKTAHEVEGLTKKAEHEINSLVKNAEHGLHDAADSLKQTFEDDLRELAENAIEEVEEVIEKAAHALITFSTTELLHRFIDLLQHHHITPEEFPELDLSVVRIKIKDVNERIDALQEYADKGVHSRDDIVRLVETLAPTYVTIVVSARLVALVASTNATGMGFKVPIPTAKLVGKIDDVLKDLGV